MPSAVKQVSRNTPTPPRLPTADRLRQHRVRIGSAHSPLAAVLHQAFRPAIASLSLLISLWLCGAPFSYTYPALAIIVFTTSYQLLTEAPHLGNTPPLKWLVQTIPRLVLEWLCVVILILFIGFAMKIPELHSRKLILCWSVAGPTLILAMELAKARLTRLLASGQQRHIVVGANELGLELNRRITNIGNSSFVGYFDDRKAERLPKECRQHLLGNTNELVSFVQRHAIDAVYISLPVTGNERTNKLINALRDTTASIYLLSDILSFDTIQSRFVEIDGLPVVSIYDTPFDGSRALIKRGMDIVMSSIALLMLWPIMVLIAIGVKLTSAGPILFKQKRYGMHGEEIKVYKFRSMTVCENDSKVTQATRGDTRITWLGKFLRKSSLDELPQIINVLEGKMSLVGPRPHAIAHNEHYRKLINGYMFRHKVRPGITGWAQVNGLRGETATIDKMRQRVEHDLDYLRHWSLWMDLKIVLKTVRLVFGDSTAY
ncbi:MAG: undecaprenyl-phosphate glucose phosphotransferase [Steroidobacteraceae bacterium]